MAKGARGKSKLASSAGLELFNEAQFVFYRKATRDLQMLKEWSLVAAHTPLREDLDRMTVGSAIMELLSRCLHEEDPHPELVRHRRGGAAGARRASRASAAAALGVRIAACSACSASRCRWKAARSAAGR